MLELLEGFTECTTSLIPRVHNVIVDALDTSSNVFKILVYPNRKYEI